MMEQIAAGEAPLRSQHDIVMARQIVRRLSQELSFSLVDQTKMVTAASELARNTLTYGGGGDMHWHTLHERHANAACGWCSPIKARGSRICELALTDGWTSGTGLGLGLTGARRLVNEFEIESSPTGHAGDDCALELTVVLQRSREQRRHVIEEESQIGEARRDAQRLAVAYGLDDTQTGRVAIAATELATNLYPSWQRRRIAAATHQGGGPGGHRVTGHRQRPWHERRRAAVWAMAIPLEALPAPVSAPCGACRLSSISIPCPVKARW